jgi:hypothetical protein
MSVIAKMVEVAVMNLVTVKIRHIAFLLAEKTVKRKMSQAGFLECFSQNGIFGPFMRFNSASGNLHARLWKIRVAENKEMIVVGNISKDLVLDFHGCMRPFFLRV